jgi:hypothetical protein
LVTAIDTTRWVRYITTRVIELSKDIRCDTVKSGFGPNPDGSRQQSILQVLTLGSYLHTT